MHAIHKLVEPYAARRILIAKELVYYYESVQEFVVAEVADEVVGCGALHVLWHDLGEVRTLAVKPTCIRKGIGHALLEELFARARAMGLSRLFCLTFERCFFARHGFVDITDSPIDASTYTQLLRSYDDGVAQFLDLARMKPNTLGNTRMLAML